jgi:hypothetical protein
MLMCCQRGYVLRAPSLGTIAISGATLRQYQALRQNKTPLHFSNSSAYAIESTGTILLHGQVLQYCKSRCYAIAITCPCTTVVEATPLLHSQVLYYGNSLVLHYHRKKCHTGTRSATTLLQGTLLHCCNSTTLRRQHTLQYCNSSCYCVARGASTVVRSQDCSHCCGL